ncbi:MAG: hypothetical protein F6K02_11210 [Moorea sp. SIO3A5]|nr:hypothetical protein [Moorena sp. SIO3A5]
MKVSPLTVEATLRERQRRTTKQPSTFTPKQPSTFNPSGTPKANNQTSFNLQPFGNAKGEQPNKLQPSTKQPSTKTNLQPSTTFNQTTFNPK